jgi:hypothetical protein
MLELRILLPPIYHLDPRFVIVNTETKECQIVLSEALFDRENAYIPLEVTKQDLMYRSPEELCG